MNSPGSPDRVTHLVAGLNFGRRGSMVWPSPSPPLGTQSEIERRFVDAVVSAPPSAGSAGSAPEQIVVGRQAIEDRDREVYGYELLFRSRREPDGPAVTGEQMTAEVIFGALNIGLDQLVDGRRIFCNADRAVLLGQVPLTLPPGQTVIELAGDVRPDTEVLEAGRRLVGLGYHLALDDFAWSADAPALLELASIVKIDVRRVDPTSLDAGLQQCRQFGVQLLADKVETAAQLDHFRDLGFDLFQGFYLERPFLVSGRTLAVGQATRVKMVATVLRPDVGFDELDEMLHADPGLAVQVMQLASIGRPGETRREINTIRDALVLAGTRRVANWVALLLARPARSEATTDAVDAYNKMLVRARTCELLAGQHNSREASLGFAAGLLSALDLLLGVPTEELRGSLALGDDLAEAAFGEEGELARLVRDVADYQLGSGGANRRSSVDSDQLDEAFARAFAWSMQTAGALSA